MGRYAFFGTRSPFGPASTGPFFGLTSGSHPDEIDRQTRVRTGDSVWHSFTVDSLSNTTTDEVVFKTRINGEDGNQVITVPASTTGNFSTSNTDTLVNNDKINYRCSGSGSGSNSFISTSFIDATASAATMIGSSPGSAPQSGSTNFYQLNTNSTPAIATADETPSQVRAPFTFILSNLRVYVGLNNIDSGTSTFVVRKDGADTALSISIPSSTTGEFTNDGSQVSLSQNDLFALKLAVSGTSGSLRPTLWDTKQTGDKQINSTFLFTVAPLSGVTRFYPLCCANSSSTFSTANRRPLPHPGSFDTFRVGLSTNTTSEDMVCGVYVDGTQSNLKATIPSSTTGHFESTNSISLGTSELVNLFWDRPTSSGTIFSRQLSLSSLFEPPAPISVEITRAIETEVASSVSATQDISVEITKAIETEVAANLLPPVMVDLVGNFIWRVLPSPIEVQRALIGVNTGVTIKYRFIKVDSHKHQQFLEDVTDAFLTEGNFIELNNNRTIRRAAQFSIDKKFFPSLSEFMDHIVVVADVLVNRQIIEPLPLGLFHIDWAHKIHHPGGYEEWVVPAFDITLHLTETGPDGPYTVAAGQNYISGTNAVTDIFDNLMISNNFPVTDKTLDSDWNWTDVEISHSRIVNDLLQAAGFYAHRMNVNGVGVTAQVSDITTRTPDVSYGIDDFLINDGPIREEVITTRLANKIIAYTTDPDSTPLVAVAVNDDPDSPISTVNLGRVIRKFITRERATSLTVLQQAAEDELLRSMSSYRKLSIKTQPDPRRGAFAGTSEIYEILIPDANIEGRWQCQSWFLPLTVGASMIHDISRVEKVNVSIEEI